MDKEQEKAAKARESALKGALTQIERQFGQGSIMKMGDEAAAVRVQAIPTGALSLDLALGVGGLPQGRIVEIFGPESSGKTTLLYHVLANAQQMGGICAFIDAEHAMDPAYAEREIQRQRSGRDGAGRYLRVVVHAHDRSLAVLTFDLAQGHVEGLLALHSHQPPSGTDSRTSY